MIHWLYNAALTLAAPAGAVYLAATRRTELLQRFHPAMPPGLQPGALWLQACSVGEYNTAKPLLQALERQPDTSPLLLTVSTLTAREMATKAVSTPLTWFPFDHPLSVAGFLRRARPRALILMETELWPNILRHCARARIPVILVNGRLSDRHLPRYRRLRPIIAPMLRAITAAGMQNDEYAARIAGLGMPPERIHVTGNIKFDGVATQIDPARLASLRRQHGFDSADTILVFGSTRPGDERLAAECWQNLRTQFPNLRLIIAPRHADRLADAVAPFRGEPYLLRSQVKEGRRWEGERILFVDTLGELLAFYALATVAVVGGSFYPGVNGHNPLEPAGLGIPTVFGPYMRNFIDPARELTIHNGAVQVDSPQALTPALALLLADPGARAQLAQNAAAAIARNQGALDRTVALIRHALEQNPHA